MCIKNYIMKHLETIFSTWIFPILYQQEEMYNFTCFFNIIKVINRVGFGLSSIKRFSLKDVCTFLETGISGLLQVEHLLIPQPRCTLELIKPGNFIKMWISRVPSLLSEFTRTNFQLSSAIIWFPKWLIIRTTCVALKNIMIKPHVSSTSLSLTETFWVCSSQSIYVFSFQNIVYINQLCFDDAVKLFLENQERG